MNPLADKLRPTKLSEIIGQKHIIGEEKLLYKAIKSGNVFSMILWGPPGVGKTTLARVIANEIEAEFMEFSAVTTGIAELKKIFESLSSSSLRGVKRRSNLREIEVATQTSFVRNDGSVRKSNEKVVIFIDEIHRFNKAQQDAFLPYVENGTITLIGATTENPSFEIISPLLSRSRVFVLQPLADEDLEAIINRGIKFLGVKIKKDAKEFLKEFSNGDGRVILNTLEIAAQSLNTHVIARSETTKQSQLGQDFALADEDHKRTEIASEKAPRNDVVGGEGASVITKSLLEEALQKKALMYDKAGEEHYNTISSYLKSMRASNVDAALHYLARMVEAGEDSKFIARRMVIFASEDIGMAQPTALVVANEVFRACEIIGYPECAINLAHGTVYLANAKKDRRAYDAYFKAVEDVRKHGNLPIPLKLRNAPTKLMKKQGYGKGYEMYTDEDLLPEKLKGTKYYQEKE